MVYAEDKVAMAWMDNKAVYLASNIDTVRFYFYFQNSFFEMIYSRVIQKLESPDGIGRKKRRWSCPCRTRSMPTTRRWAGLTCLIRWWRHTGTYPLGG